MVELTFEQRKAMVEAAFEGAPATFVPALTIRALELSIRAGVWAPRGLSLVAERVQLQHLQQVAKKKPYTAPTLTCLGKKDG